MDNPQAQFSDDETRILSELNKEIAQEATIASEQPAEAEPQAATEPAVEPATSQAEAQPEAAAAPEAPTGDLRAALRASRRAERKAREDKERLEREIADLRAGKAAPKPESDDLTDEELAELEQDMPLMAKAVKSMRKVAAVAAPAPAEPAKDEWTPPLQPAEVQDAVDTVPELLAWQNDQDQRNFSLAVAADAMLRNLPAWANKPLAERLAEATHRVKVELAAASPAPSQQTKRRDPAEVIANAPAEQPNGIGDFRGGAAPNKVTPNYARMTDEQIMASLPVT